MIKSKIIYALVVLALFGFSILYVDNLAVVMLSVCLVLPLFLGLILLVSARNMTFAIETDDHNCYRKDQINIKIIAKKPVMLPVCYKLTFQVENLYTGEISTKTIAGIVLGKKQESYVQIKVHHCGHIKIYIKKAKAYDYFKVFSKKLSCGEACNIVVVPNVYEFDGQMVTMPTFDDEGNIYSTTKSGDDPTEIFDIHQYKDGDDPRRIHWNLSSRTEEYFVKDYGRPLMNSIVLLLDNQCDSVSKQDGLFDVMLSLSNFLLQNGIGHNLCMEKEGLGLTLCSITNEDELFETADGLLSQPFKMSSKSSVVDDFINSPHSKNAHIIFLTSTENNTKNPLLHNHIIPVTAMVMTNKFRDVLEAEDNFRCFYINEKNILSSLEGIEL